MRIAVIIQARTNSTRLPNKINADIGGWPMLKHVARRIGAAISQRVSEVATYEWRIAMPQDYPHLREEDVLGRYFEAAAGFDAIMRVTGDCPLLDPEVCQDILDIFELGFFDYVANDIIPTFPDGLGCEVFSFDALKYTHQHADKAYDREHVTTFLKSDKRFMKYQAHNVWCFTEHDNPKLSVDTQEDLDFVRRIDAAKPHDFSLEATLGAIERVKAQDLAQRT